MRILFVGDVFGAPGRDLVRRGLRVLDPILSPDLVVANVENAAAGFGITRETGDAILDCGVDAMTTGNHVWDKKEALAFLEAEPRLLRPANYPPGAPGRGSVTVPARNGHLVGVLNVMGRVFMTPIDDPFACAAREAGELRAKCRVVLLDFHAEATSEKVAMGWHLDGKVTAVIGTHTHVQTADERILPAGTAYITDVGMTGPHESIIGTDKEATLRRFLTGLPARLEPATGDPRLHAVLVTADEVTGRATGIQRISFTADDLDRLRDLPRDRATAGTMGSR